MKPVAGPCASRGICTTLFLGLLGAALLVSPRRASAQGASPDSNVVYAKVWTPRSETGRLHLHGGVFVPIDAPEVTAANLGLRLGFNIGSHLLIGALTDWNFRSKSLTQDSDSLPGIQPKIELARVDAHLIPVMAFLQVKLTDKFPIVPYIGVGAGYEWLIRNANDYRDGRSDSRTYQNWAWQSYAGLGLALGRDVRLDGELFLNGASLRRDIVDAQGVTWSEKVDMSGVGARLGVDILY